MKHRFTYQCLAFLLYLLLQVGGFQWVSAQDDRAFDESSMNAYREDPRYDYGLQPLPKEQEVASSSAPSGINAGRIGQFIMYLIVVIALGLIGFLIIRQYAGSRKNTKLVESQESLPEVEVKDIRTVNFARRIAQAEEKGNYRLAVRWQFLNLLKKLNEKKLIKWQQNKTNMDYYFELRRDSLKENFDQLSQVFDYVWYGKFAVNESRYEQMKSNFQGFMKSIT